jgi:hypothetical protein
LGRATGGEKGWLSRLMFRLPCRNNIAITLMIIKNCFLKNDPSRRSTSRADRQIIRSNAGIGR